MHYTIHISDGAKFDLDELQSYHTREVSSSFASTYSNTLLDVVQTLSKNPQRGHRPPELLDDLSEQQVREIHYKNSRIIYEIYEQSVNVLAVAHTRRDIRDLLQRRMLRP